MSTNLELPISTPQLWGGLAALLLVAVVAGFWAGVMCAPALQEWAFRRSIRSLRRFTSHLNAELQRIHRYGEILNASMTQPLEPQHWRQLETLSQQLRETWLRLSGRQPSPGTIASLPERNRQDRMTWQREPVEPETSLPDKTAFEANLKQMLAAGATQDKCGGVLMIRIDKLEQLILRYGPSAGVSLQERVANLIVQSARDSDLVCRLNSDLFAILMPHVAALDGIRIAETIRSTVREHTFRFDEEGPAVLVTASFGFVVCVPGDPVNLIVDRAAEAVDKSQSMGRNQLHAHDGCQRILVHVH